MDGRPACIYCGQCGRGCATASNYASSYVQIFPAMETGHVTVLTNAMARELITDDVGQSHRRVVHRQGDRRRTAGAMPHRGAVGRGVRVGAAAAQLEIAAASAGPRQSERHGRQVPHRHGRLRHVGARCRCMRGTPPFSTRTATARTSTSRGGCSIATSELDFPLRLSRRSRRRRVRACRASGSARGTYNRAEGYGLPMKQAIRDGYGRARTSASAAAARWCRTRTATARSIRTARRTSGAFRCCASTGSGATTS